MKKTTKPTKQELCAKRLERVLVCARRWARNAEQFTVLSSPSHHLLRAIQAWEKETTDP